MSFFLTTSILCHTDDPGSAARCGRGGAVPVSSVHVEDGREHAAQGGKGHQPGEGSAGHQAGEIFPVELTSGRCSNAAFTFFFFFLNIEKLQSQLL